jgi:hypothetical protein
VARTEAGAVLTAEHRRAQLQVRAATLRDYVRLWPLWQGDDESFARLVAATVPLIRAHHRTSSAVAAAYYDSFRRAERVDGTPTPRLAELVNVDQVTASLYVTGLVAARRARAAGRSADVVRRNALTRTSGAVSRHVLTGGRDTLIQSVAADRQALGWARVTDGAPCAFCAILASRGAVYSKNTANFQAHDHCACSVEPVYADSALPPHSQRFRDLYEQAKRERPDDPINGLRRLLNA